MKLWCPRMQHQSFILNHIQIIIMNHQFSIKLGTITGTTLSILGSIGWADIERTLVLGTIGAVISFLVSYSLKSLMEKRK